MDRQLNLISININGLYNKRLQLTDAINKNKTDIVLLQETLLKSRHDFRFPNMTMYRTDREGRRGGGTAIMIKRNIRHHETKIELTNKQIEMTTIRVHTSTGDIKIASIYIPPSTNVTKEDFDEIFETDETMIIMGDFNAKHEHWGCRVTNAKGRTLNTALLQHKNVYLTTPNNHTHIDGRGNLDTLDYMISINTNRTNPLITLHDIGSDHLPITTTLQYEPNIYNGKPPTRAHHYDWNTFKTQINQTLHYHKLDTDTHDGIEQAARHLTEAIDTALTKSTLPNNTARKHRALNVPQNILTLIQRKHRLEKLDKVNGTREHRTEINQLSKTIKTQLTKHREEEFDKFIEKIAEDHSTHKIRKIPKILRNKPRGISRLTTDSLTAETDTDKANMIAKTLKQQFTPLPLNNTKINRQIQASNTYIDQTPPQNTHNIYTIKSRIKHCIKHLKDHKAPGLDGIRNYTLKRLTPKAVHYMARLFTLCLNKCYFPDEYKTANIIPILKQGKPRTGPTSYRPISLLSNLSKMLERLIYDEIWTHLNNENIITNAQCGFRPGHSTTDQLWRITTTIQDQQKDWKCTTALFVDMEKAFDKVNHDALTHKLHSYGFHTNITKIIRSYLHNRKFTVQ